MFMKKTIITLLAALLYALDVCACTSAVVAGIATKNHRPIIWKNRDTDAVNNKVGRVCATDSTFEYVALFNAADSLFQNAWIGFNSQGFAILNTASYNLKDDTIPDECMDQEGRLMSIALRKCRTVDDFEKLLNNLPKPLYVEANFGVMDAKGNGAYFETNNTTFRRYNVSDAPSGVLTRTNYSYSGRTDKGMGYIREENERYLLRPFVQSHSITPATFTEVLSRSFYHSLIGKDFATDTTRWVIDQDFIPRHSTTASVVIEGVLPGENPSLTTMWIAMGYPPCAKVQPVWLGEGGVPDSLQGLGKNGHSAQCDKVLKRKHEVFPIKRGNGIHYIDMRKLFNDEGTGYSQILSALNDGVYRQGYLELDKRRAALKKKKK
jgi:hypothetical protein